MEKHDADLDAPDGLTPDGEQARQAIVAFLRERDTADTGGCRAFYAPDEWKRRGEEYGRESILVVVHDGGDLAPYFNLDYGCYSMYESMQDMLNQLGFRFEQCTSWYSAIYKD